MYQTSMDFIKLNSVFSTNYYMFSSTLYVDTQTNIEQHN